MRRILKLVAVATVVAVMTLAVAMPALADRPGWCYVTADRGLQCNIYKHVCETSGFYAPPDDNCFAVHFTH